MEDGMKKDQDTLVTTLTGFRNGQAEVIALAQEIRTAQAKGDERLDRIESKLYDALVFFGDVARGISPTDPRAPRVAKTLEFMKKQARPLVPDMELIIGDVVLVDQEVSEDLYFWYRCSWQCVA
jgi:hypothetical protein